MRERVLEELGRQGKPVSVRELVRRLGLEGDERRELKGVLRRMLADGELANLHGARVGLPERMSLVVGRLSCSPSGHGFVRPERREAGRRDVFVSALGLKEALHGDRVVVRVERQGPKGPEGRIVRVLERALQRLVGRYEGGGRAGGHVVPFDRRVLQELLVPAGDEAGAADGTMVLAEITRPPTATRNPVGRVLTVLGRLEEPGVDVAVMVAKHDLPGPFPLEVEREVEAVPRQVRSEDLSGRTDFRGWPTVTVDPESARDHDDAISLDRLPDGWRLGVHIADVAHYVRPGTALDQEAYLRGTSVYFPDRVLPMLPHALSSGVCSLVAGEDRLTQTVVLELDGEGRVRRTEFHDGVIRSAARMSYQQVQAIVGGDAALRERFSPLVDLFLRLDELSKLMRARRFERGSLDLDLPEPRLLLDEKGEVKGVVAGERLDSMRAIEEFMLAANEAVAGRLSLAAAPTLYRVHEQPDPEKVEELAELVASFGYRLPARLEDVRPEDFQRLLREIAGKPEEKLVSSLLLRTMKLARYHEENLGHFGLATSMYAHFTSPIRRYPDLIAHRALRALRRGAEPSAELREALPGMGEHLSGREQRAAEAERELLEWKKVRYMAGRLGERFSGYVTGVQAFGLFVELEEVFVQGLVHVSSMCNDYYLLEEAAHGLRGQNLGKLYRLGDRVEVVLSRVDLERRMLDFSLIDVLEGSARGPSARDPGPRGARARRPAAAPPGSRQAGGSASRARGGRPRPHRSE